MMTDKWPKYIEYRDFVIKLDKYGWEPQYSYRLSEGLSGMGYLSEGRRPQGRREGGGQDADAGEGETVTGQLVMPATFPGSYWVRVTGHRVWPDGALFLVVREWHGDWLLCWENGVKPQPEKRLGTLLRRGQVERI